MESESLLVGAETKQENVVQNNSRTKFREIVRYVLGYTPIVKDIKLVSVNNSYDGIMSFEVPLESLGMSTEVLKKYHSEIFTNRFVNIIAEVILRENLTLFVDEMIKMDVSEYRDALSTRKHENFGMKVKNSCLVFDFHVSFLQDVVMSDFRGQIKQ